MLLYCVSLKEQSVVSPNRIGKHKVQCEYSATTTTTKTKIRNEFFWNFNKTREFLVQKFSVAATVTAAAAARLPSTFNKT